MKSCFGFLAFIFLICRSTTAFSCGDLDIFCHLQERVDPDCRGDICKVIKPADDLAGKIVDNAIKGVTNSPDDIRQCLSDAQKCLVNVLAMPLAAVQVSYVEFLNRQAEGSIYSFSNEFINLTQPYYDIDLRGVTFSDNINTLHGQAVAICDRIYFTQPGNIWVDKKELWLTLHEMEHLVQCQKRGRQAFLAEYLLKGIVSAANGSTNIHDNHELEFSANAKADALVDDLWYKIQNRIVPVPGEQSGTPAIGVGAPWPTIQTAIPVRFCATPVGICSKTPAYVPMGTTCYCSGFDGQTYSGSAF
ncbi:MAG: hypothetical protein WCO61_01135 [Alphaproteobacteria bacterium]